MVVAIKHRLRELFPIARLQVCIAHKLHGTSGAMTGTGFEGLDLLFNSHAVVHAKKPPEPQVTPTGYSPEANSTMGDSSRARRERRMRGARQYPKTTGDRVKKSTSPWCLGTYT